MLPPAGQPAEGSWRLNYVTGNLFSCPEDEALAHCISEDCRMGAGIAVMFKQKFKGLEELKNQSESDFLLKTSIVEEIISLLPRQSFCSAQRNCFLFSTTKAWIYCWKNDLILYCLKLSHTVCILYQLMQMVGCIYNPELVRDIGILVFHLIDNSATYLISHIFLVPEYNATHAHIHSYSNIPNLF